MPAYIYIHPLFGILAIALIWGALAMKMGRRKFSTLHYATGLAAFIAVFTAIGIAVWAVERFSTEIDNVFDVLPLVTLVPHIIAAALALLSLLVQVGVGVTMHTFKHITGRVFRFHRYNAWLLVGLTVLIFVLGLTTIELMPGKG